MTVIPTTPMHWIETVTRRLWLCGPYRIEWARSGRYVASYVDEMGKRHLVAIAGDLDSAKRRCRTNADRKTPAPRT
jgi:hypothetical protein